MNTPLHAPLYVRPPPHSPSTGFAGRYCTVVNSGSSSGLVGGMGGSTSAVTRRKTALQHLLSFSLPASLLVIPSPPLFVSHTHPSLLITQCRQGRRRDNHVLLLILLLWFLSSHLSILMSHLVRAQEDRVRAGGGGGEEHCVIGEVCVGGGEVGRAGRHLATPAQHVRRSWLR